MLHLLVALASLDHALPALPPERISHHGVDYEVLYHPQIRTATRTLGAHAGARAGVQRCRAVTEIVIERAVRRPDGSATVVQQVAGTARLTTFHHGSCEQNRHQLARLKTQQRAVIAMRIGGLVARDRPALLAQIEAARALAVN